MKRRRRPNYRRMGTHCRISLVHQPSSNVSRILTLAKSIYSSRLLNSRVSLYADSTKLALFFSNVLHRVCSLGSTNATTFNRGPNYTDITPPSLFGGQYLMFQTEGMVPGSAFPAKVDPSSTDEKHFEVLARGWRRLSVHCEVHLQGRSATGRFGCPGHDRRGFEEE
jgi:hypothetical protein